ncbi:PAS domain S-box protein [Roseomonas nepalensis]|uniref:histidine kinase n=1 Tax=Muricoccus nepalensis TaxID=1854500 RepID=A0A502GH18_9PROT|nr:HWE histidine kinase domain-containing protein [Roseomonas nepalensis]TPG61175.1 PAS domain S-box protein [Roseomonas nepalensis]
MPPFTSGTPSMARRADPAPFRRGDKADGPPSLSLPGARPALLAAGFALAAGVALALTAVGTPLASLALLTGVAGFVLGAGFLAATRGYRGQALPGSVERLALDLAAVIVRTPEGTIRYWSPGAERLFGYTAGEAVGRLAHELLRTRFMEGGRRTAMAELMQAGHWQGELRHRRRDGVQTTVATAWEMRRAGAESLIVEASTEALGLKAAEEELRASEGRLRLAQEVAEIGTFEWHPGTEEQDWSPEQHALFGTSLDAEARPTVERLVALVLPEDQAPLRAALAHAEETGEYEAEFRIRRRTRDGGEETRWLYGRGRRMPGRAGSRGSIVGMHVDTTARKDAEMRQTLLIREVDHRAKNALTVVQAILRLTRAPDQAAYVRAVEGRVAALARAQTLLTQSGWSGADLRTLIEGELAPFLTTGGLGPTVVVSGSAAMVPPVIAQPLSMAVHELATNAVKHGALSVPGGLVRIDWSVTPGSTRRLTLRWRESGGPSLPARPSRCGFGSRVLQTTVQNQLGGYLTQHWPEAGLECQIDIPLPGPAQP